MKDKPDHLPHVNCNDTAYRLAQHPPHTHVLLYDRTTPRTVWCEGYEGEVMPAPMQLIRHRILKGSRQ